MNIQNMILNLIVFTIPLISVTYIIVGIKLSKQDVENKINYFSFLMFACAMYSFGYFLELNCVSLDILLIIRDFEFLGSVFVPTFGTLFIMGLTKVKVTKKISGILFTVSLMLWLFFITNPLYHLIYKSIGMRIVGGFGIVDAIRGPFFYSMMLYYMFFMIFSSILLTKSYKNSKKTKRKNSFQFLFVSLQIPWFTIFFILFKFDTYVDPVPATIIIIAVLFGINEIKNNMFELEIKRWNIIFTNIGEPAFLVNTLGEIVCSNIDEKSFFSNKKKSIRDIINNLDDLELNRKPISFIVNNEIRWFDVKKNDFDPKKKFTNYLLIDSTERKLAEDSLKESEEKYRFILNASPDGITITDLEGNILMVSPSSKKMFGYEMDYDEFIGMRLIDFIVPEDMKRAQSNINLMYQASYQRPNEYRGVHKDQSIFDIEVNSGFISNTSGQPTKMIFIIRDITKRKLVEQQIQQLVHDLEIEKNTDHLNSITDSLTGLMNRRYFDEALKTELNKLRHSGLGLSLIMLDVDYFKKFNDTYGHLAGDDCLRRIGATLKTIAGRIPNIVSRYGGEEFVVILEETEDNRAKMLAQQIRKSVEELAIPHVESDISEFVTISLGVVTIYMTEVVSPQQVVALADEALYYAKKSGRNRIEVAIHNRKLANNN